MESDHIVSEDKMLKDCVSMMRRGVLIYCLIYSSSAESQITLRHVSR